MNNTAVDKTNQSIQVDPAIMSDIINILRYDPNKISICAASKHGDWSVVRSLLNQGVSINYTLPNKVSSNNPNQTTVNSKSRSNINNASTSPSHKDDKAVSHMYSPLIAATAYNQTNLVTKFLKLKSININIRNNFQQTPLMFAAYLGNEDLCLKYLKLGCDRWIKDINGKIAADYAILNVHSLQNLFTDLEQGLLGAFHLASVIINNFLKSNSSL